MAWVAVDNDGTEKLSASPMWRRGKHISILFGLVHGFYSKNKSKSWANMWSTNEYDVLPFNGVVLPRGSVERLIGRRLTWRDEPVEI